MHWCGQTRARARYQVPGAELEDGMNLGCQGPDVPGESENLSESGDKMNPESSSQNEGLKEHRRYILPIGRFQFCH